MAATLSGGHLGGSKDIRSDRKYCREHTVIGQQTFECHEVVPSSIIVSFMHLPAYIEDAEIEMTLRSMKRRLYPGTTIADETRYANVKLPDTMSSNAYTIKFQKEY